MLTHLPWKVRLFGGSLKYTHVIWDFNGTVLDDVAVGIEAVNTLLARRAIPRIPSKERYRELFRFPVIEYYTDLGFDFEKESYDEVAVEWVNEYLARVPNAPIHVGVRQTIQRIAELGVPQILLSATQWDMLQGQLADLGLSHAFSAVYGLDTIHAGSKKRLAEQLRDEYPDGKFLFVGDTDHDYEVSKVADGDCLLFSGGHQSKRRLQTMGCPVIDDISDIVFYL